jgi:hypothetical protein
MLNLQSEVEDRPKNSDQEKGNLSGTSEALLGHGVLLVPKFDDMYYKDITFSILFYANVLVIVIIAFSSGITSKDLTVI